jgi:hypothetical protein
MDTARFRKEALYSACKLNSGLSAKEEISFACLDAEAATVSFLRRKTAQGKAKFEKPDDTKK